MSLRNIVSVASVSCMGLLVSHAVFGQEQVTLKPMLSTYSIDRIDAKPGDTLVVTGTFLNSSSSDMTWTPPSKLNAVWQTDRQQIPMVVESANVEAVIIPKKSFTTLSWEVVVPEQLGGRTTLVIQNQDQVVAMLALDVVGHPPSASVALGKGGEVNVSDTHYVYQAGYRSQVDSEDAHLKSDYEISALDRFQSSIYAYEPVYFIVDPGNENSARFQLSFKFRPFQPSGEESPFLDHFYFGYTQTSMWDLGLDSKPFRDTSYRPSLFWNDPVLWREGGWTLGAATGLEHESNGKKKEDSRSLDLFYVQPQIHYDANELGVFSFSPRVHYYIDKDENPDITDYRGYVNWNLRWTSKSGIVVSALLRHGSVGNSQDVAFAYPLRKTWLSSLNGYAYVQYQGGHGDTLLDYNKRSDGVVRFGLSIVP